MTDLVEKVAAALLESWGNGELCAVGSPCCEPLRDDARRAIDAVMPVVDTVEALDALPYGTKLMDAGGSVWWRSAQVGWWYGNGGYGETRSREVLAEAPPVRVIWMPEADCD